jgi:hypothetical protein
MTENQEFDEEDVEKTQNPDSEGIQEADEFQPSTVKKSGTKWWIAGLSGLIVLCIAALAIFVVLDPFNIQARFFGSPDPITKMIPDDTMMYLGVNLFELNSAEMRGIFKAFREAYDIDPEEVETNLHQDLGFSVMEDLTPWIGQFAGFALMDLPDDFFNYPGEVPPMMVLVEVRNKSKANKFVNDYVTYREEQGDEFVTTQIGRYTFYELQEEDFPILIGLYKNMLILGSKADVVENLVDFNDRLFGKPSLGKSGEYKEVLKQMPKNRFASLYFDSEKYFQLVEGMSEDMYGLNGAFFNNLQTSTLNYGLSITAVEPGLEFDIFLKTDSENLPNRLINLEKLDYEQQLANFYPDNTMLFVSGYIPEGYVENYSESFQSQPGVDESIVADYQEAIELFEDQSGVDLEKLGQSIEGEFSIGLYEQSEGFLNEVAMMPFGLNIMIGINDSTEISKLFDYLHELGISLGLFFDITYPEIAGYELEEWAYHDAEFDFPILAFGMSDENVLITTGGGVLELLSGEGDSLANSSKYQETWEFFSEGDVPGFYLDLESFYEMLEANDPYGEYSTPGGGSILGPITHLAGASSAGNPNQARSTVILFIDYELTE